MVEVRIANPLRSLTGGIGRVVVEANDLDGVVRALESTHPGFSERVIDDHGRLRSYVLAFVGDQESRSMAGMATPVGPDAVVSIVAAVAGG